MKKNRNLLLASVLIFLVLVIVFSLTTKPVNERSLSTVSPEFAGESPTDSSLATVNSERTAIAVFTQNPTLALSSTPFYAEIIYNEIIRNLTEIPYPPRSYYITSVPTISALATKSPSNDAMLTSQASNVNDVSCITVISTWALGDQSRALINMLQKEENINSTVNVVSLGVEGLDKDCRIPFQAVQSRIQVSIVLSDVDNNFTTLEILMKITGFLVRKWNSIQYISKRADILIYISGAEGAKTFATNYDAMLNAVTENLSDEALLNVFEKIK
ncbi:MAG: hypothetical protein R3E39_26330 [Anaerolineae bacterium]